MRTGSVTVAVAVATTVNGIRYFTVDSQDGCRYTTHNGRYVTTGFQPVGDSGRDSSRGRIRGRVSVWDRNRERGRGRHRGSGSGSGSESESESDTVAATESETVTVLDSLVPGLLER